MKFDKEIEITKGVDTSPHFLNSVTESVNELAREFLKGRIKYSSREVLLWKYHCLILSIDVKILKAKKLAGFCLVNIFFTHSFLDKSLMDKESIHFCHSSRPKKACFKIIFENGTNYKYIEKLLYYRHKIRILQSHDYNFGDLCT